MQPISCLMRAFALQSHPDAKAILYFSTCACVEYFTKALQAVLPKPLQSQLPILALHGKMVCQV
jgi:hypothetical protein